MGRYIPTLGKTEGQPLSLGPALEAVEIFTLESKPSQQPPRSQRRVPTMAAIKKRLRIPLREESHALQQASHRPW